MIKMALPDPFGRVAIRTMSGSLSHRRSTGHFRSHVIGWLRLIRARIQEVVDN